MNQSATPSPIELPAINSDAIEWMKENVTGDMPAQIQRILMTLCEQHEVENFRLKVSRVKMYNKLDDREQEVVRLDMIITDAEPEEVADFSSGRYKCFHHRIHMSINNKGTPVSLVPADVLFDLVPGPITH